MGIKSFGKKLLGKSRATDRTEEYWKIESAKSVESVMESICDQYDPKTFETKKEGVLFSQNIKLDERMTVLDLACGMGRTCRWVAPFVRKYIGVDFMEDMIIKARVYNEKFHNVEFITNNGRDLANLPSETFDLVYCDLAFQHMVKPIQQSYVDEVYRVMKKGGLFYVQIAKFDYYKKTCDDAKNFANTKEEVDKMFQKFSNDRHFGHTYTEISDAYFFIKAVK